MTTTTHCDAGRIGDGSASRLNPRRESQPADEFTGNAAPINEVFNALAAMGDSTRIICRRGGWPSTPRWLNSENER